MRGLSEIVTTTHYSLVRVRIFHREMPSAIVDVFDAKIACTTVCSMAREIM
jgi:hypothetical protein